MRETYKEECFAKRTIRYWHESFSHGRQEYKSHPPKMGQVNKNICREWRGGDIILKNSLPRISTVTSNVRVTLYELRII